MIIVMLRRSRKQIPRLVRKDLLSNLSNHSAHLAYASLSGLSVAMGDSWGRSRSCIYACHSLRVHSATNAARRSTEALSINQFSKNTFPEGLFSHIDADMLYKNKAPTLSIMILLTHNQTAFYAPVLVIIDDTFMVSRYQRITLYGTTAIY